jgi:ATP-dependent Clp protease, protease subunit
MQALQCDVATVCLGFAASMAQFLLCAGAPKQRRAHTHSRILMHQPLGAVEGYAVDVAIQAEQFTLARRLMAELTAQHTGQTVERIIADGDRDRWFTASEALEYGMIDEVITPST